MTDMNTDSVLKILDSITRLLGIIIWPAPFVSLSPILQSFRSRVQELRHPEDFNRLKLLLHLQQLLLRAPILMLLPRLRRETRGRRRR
jgi:hypothetical protein